MPRPQVKVLNAFKIKGEPAQSDDGFQGVYFVDDFILKYYDDEHEAQYICECYHQLAAMDMVVPEPILSLNQRYVEDNWIAYPKIPAQVIKGEFTVRHQIVKSFNERTRGLPWKQALHARRDPWSTAHQIALGIKAVDAAYSPHARDRISQLLGLCDTPMSDLAVYHGDLANNIMLHEDGKRPVVLDFSPVLAPARYSEAIFLVDIFAHQGAPESLLSGIIDDGLLIELLVRATVFRIACSAEFEKRFQTKSFQKEANEWMHALSTIQHLRDSGIT